MATGPLPSYKNPPVNEVVCGVLFKPLERLLAPYFGLLWEVFKKDYPECREAPPIVPLVEVFGDADQPTVPHFADIPSLPRVWFLQPGGSRIVQVQRDRFLHNWRKTVQADAYPRYEHVIEAFEQRFHAFEDFLSTNKLGSIEPRQFEITYVNHIYQGEGWNEWADIADIFRDFRWDRSSDRFLRSPESLSWRTAFAIPGQEGRLHVSIQSARSLDDRRPLCVVELTVRGIGKDCSIEGRRLWFDTAREWIVRGFADLTSDGIQWDRWKREI